MTAVISMDPSPEISWQSNPGWSGPKSQVVFQAESAKNGRGHFHGPIACDILVKLPGLILPQIPGGILGKIDTKWPRSFPWPVTCEILAKGSTLILSQIPDGILGKIGTK